MSSNWTVEGFYGLLCGLSYGLTSPLVGHPIDTLKTKQQTIHLNSSLRQTLVHSIKHDGLLSLYRGISAPLAGSLIFRSIQFGAYTAVAEFCKENQLATSFVPMTNIELSVIVGSIASGFCRATIETPLEAFKVRKQTGKPLLAFSQLYTGYSITLLRTVGLMTTFFCLIDIAGRQVPDTLNSPTLGPFFKGGVCATVAWWCVWPAEVAKSQIQAGVAGPQRIVPRLVHIVQQQGVVRGFSRGFLAGSIRSVLANGASFWAFTTCQRTRRKWFPDNKLE